jgi:hypothetical protein
MRVLLSGKEKLRIIKRRAKLRKSLAGLKKFWDTEIVHISKYSRIFMNPALGGVSFWWWSILRRIMVEETPPDGRAWKDTKQEDALPG